MSRAYAAAVWALLFGTGCPHAFGRGGTLDRAMLQDTIERLRKDSCHPDDVWDACSSDGYDECMAECEKRGK